MTEFGPVSGNTMLDIKHFLEDSPVPLKEGEFKEFWLSLTKEERDEFRLEDLKVA